MEIKKNIDHNPNLALALGFFDGVHIAHQKLIKNVVEYSRENNLKSAVITFLESPICALQNKSPKYIYNNLAKFKIIEELGIDFIYALDFKKFLNFSASDYLENILVQNFEPKFITTGFNHHFGKNKQGNYKFLFENQEKFNYIYKEVLPIKINSKLVSTTNIKKMLSDGDIESANKFLGREFKIKGQVIKGRQIGETLGFKTANVLWPEDIVKLPYGVYKVSCVIKNKKYNALANFGVCPTFENKKEALEIHILNFDEDIYDETIEVSFEKKIRDEIKFNSTDELKEQIKNDLEVF